MVIQRADRIAETTTTTGTGTYSLGGAKTGFETFVTRIASLNIVEYCCTDGTDWEIGEGIFTDATPDTIARTTILKSSNSDAAVNWAAGTKDIFLTLSATRLLPGLINQIAYHSAAGVLNGDADLTFDGTDMVLRGKLDVGAPGDGSGADFGEGGSYKADKSGTTIVKAFKYDASAGSGSRFTEFTDLDTANTWLGVVGDRFYVGSPNKFWAVRFNATTAVVYGDAAELIQTQFWNGSALTNCDHMGISKDDADSIGEQILKQTTQKEYVTYDNGIDTTWATADNVTDKIPNTGAALYWICFEVPATGLSTPPIVDEIRVRGTDFDIITGAAFPVFWGKARVEKHENISLVAVKSPGGTGTANIDMDTNHQQTVFDFNGVDDLSVLWTLPEGIDTSTRIKAELAYSASAADTYDLVLVALKLKNATAINSGVASSYTQNTAVVAAAGATVYTQVDLTATRMSIQDLASNDVISFGLSRTDSSNSIYPLTLTIHYVIAFNGEHV